MRLRMFMAFFCMSFTLQIYSFPCFITVMKDSCWTDFNVTVKVLDASSNHVVSTIVIPEGKSWAREKFVCEPGEHLMYNATFSPLFWASDKGKSYSAQNYMLLPATIGPKEKAWSFMVCYPEQFSEVPLPPTANNNCACNSKNIPPVPPQ